MLNSLQACRAVAAILVVLFHASGSIFALPKYFGQKPFGLLFDFGFAGVDFFFVLSGFIMMHVHAKDIDQPRAFGSYLWKRFSRIYPVYWIVLAVILPIFFLIPHFGVGHEREPWIILRSVFLVPNSDNQMVLSVAWTLVYEVFFYLLFGLLILSRRIGLSVIVTWTGLIFAYPWLESHLSSFVCSTMNLRFLAGVCVALILARWRISMPRLVAMLGAVVFLNTGLFEAYDGALSPWAQCAGYTLGSVLMLAGLVQAERSGTLQTPPWLVYLGNASYSIYLVHFLGLSLLAKLAKAAQLDVYIPGMVLFCLHVIGAIALGCLFHHAVEQPIHAWAKKCFRRTKSPEVPMHISRTAA